MKHLTKIPNYWNIKVILLIYTYTTSNVEKTNVEKKTQFSKKKKCLPLTHISSASSQKKIF